MTRRLLAIVGPLFLAPILPAQQPASAVSVTAPLDSQNDFGAPAEAMRRLEEITAKPEVATQLTKAWKHCRSVLGNMNRAALVPDSLPGRMGFPRVVLLVLGDQHEHLGQLIAYARSVGVAPPWSR